MKSISFIITKKTVPIDGLQIFVVPILPAYAIEYAKLNVNGQGVLLDASQIDDDKVIWDVGKSYTIGNDWEVALEIFHHGIRDYSLLFPQITVNVELAKRLGNFYEEAEKNFDNQAWLSYALMCGGIFEGLLTSKGCSQKNFSEKIRYARSNSIINTKQEEVINIARGARNKIHADRYKDPYLLRKEALDIRITMDQIIKDFAGC